MIATGYPFDNGTKTEIIDVGINYSCPKVMPFPVELYEATGGLVNGQPFLCAGYDNTNDHFSKDCYKLTHSGSWAKDDTAALNTERRLVYGSVVLQNNIFISGGYNGNRLNTIEMLSPNTLSETVSYITTWN